ncbi:unnamed protein product [Zymoseptoria tritici ST99CH_1A5]|uniref:Uncharacterized protein n=1 Tax=Zymoseptoria tritici ST99CH_1A5 TaxID=1276529 RepID=A0A1Y6M254_ZYMTR|nr:unnamed protein product [Zymoseptoria tritici ST99CH_1A5]
MQRTQYRRETILPDSAIPRHLRHGNYRAYREKLIRQIGDQIEDRQPTVFFTEDQLASLKNVDDWGKTLLEHILALSRMIASNSDSRGSIQAKIKWAQSWMSTPKRRARMSSQRAVQEVVEECCEELKRWIIDQAEEKARAARAQQEELIRGEREEAATEATAALLSVIRTSISRSTTDILEKFEGIQEQLEECKGSLTDELKTSLAVEFEQIWTKVQAPRRSGHIFWSNTSLPQDPHPVLEVTWRIPPRGVYHPESGKITYTSNRKHSEFYTSREIEPSWRYRAPKDPPETNKVFPIDPIEVKFVEAWLNERGTKEIRALTTHEIYLQDILARFRDTVRSGQLTQVSTSSQWSEET